MRAAWLVVAVAACSFEHGVAPILPLDAGPQQDDALTPDSAPAAWSVPVAIAELNSGYGEDDASLTGDLLEIYFGSKRPGGAGLEDIWRATRPTPSAAWSEPVNVTELNTGSTETTAKLTSDGLAIFFASTRSGSGDLYYASRLSRDLPWSNPVKLDSLSTSGGDWGPAARTDLLRVIWCAGPTVPAEAMFEATRATTGAEWSTPARLVGLDEADVSECDPMEPNGRALYFASDRNGSYDIYRAARTNEAAPYGPLAPISTVNTSGDHDRDPWVSADERYLVFSSNRSGTDRLYLSTR